MKRILIIGPSGAGKSWLAVQLAPLVHLPVIHLDREFWQPGWVEMPKATWSEKVRELAARDRWIMDGNYGGTLAFRMERADTIIFLDVSRWQSLAGALSRWWKMRGQPRPDMADEYPDRMNVTFLRWLWRYHEHHRPNVLEQIGDHAHGRTVHVLRSRGEIEAFIGALARAARE